MSEMKNVFVIGAQCTGKTTVVDALEKHIAQHKELDQPAIIREVARTVLAEGGFTREDIENSPLRAMQLQEGILSAQYKIETTITKSEGSKWYISDRSGLDPIVYASVFVGPDSAQTLLASEEWLTLESNMKAGLVVLCDAGDSWLTDDGVRLMPKSNEDWDYLTSAFRHLLETRNINYTMLPRTMSRIEDRISTIMGLQKANQGSAETGP